MAVGSTRPRAASRALVALAATVALSATGLSAARSPSPAVADDSPVAPAAGTGQAVTWTGDLASQAPCPEGMTRSATVHTEGFNSAIPQPTFNNGWYRIGGVEGAHSARSMVTSSNTVDWMFLPYVQAPVNARTMLGFATRGSANDPATTRVQVNSVDLRVQVATSSWQGRVYDVTPATATESGWINPWFEQRLVGNSTRTWDVDNLQIYTCRNAPVSRIGGANRYHVSANIAATYSSGRPVVFLVTGTNYPDALGGSALAGSLSAPVLLTQPNSIPEPVRAQLQRLAAQEIVILGGTSAVSEAVAQQAAGYAGQVTRITGPDRYAVSAALVESYYEPGADVLYLASGANYPDALSIGALAGHRDAPLLLTRPDRLAPVTAEQVQRLNPGQIVVVGGTAAVSPAVVTELEALTDAPVSRISGSDRYAVSSAVAAQFPTGGDRAYLATGESFPDALVGGAPAGMLGVPVLLTRSTQLTQVTAERLSALQVGSARLLGGIAALNSLVMDQAGARVG